MEYSFTRHVTIGGDEDKKEAIEYAYSKEGQEVIGDYDVMRKGIDWFIETNIKAYTTLLD